MSLLCFAVLLSIALGSHKLAAQNAPADFVLHNGKILTVDNNFSTAEAVAVRGDKIAAVGSDQDVMKLAGPNTTVIDLKGRTVIPGLIDTHAHIHNYAESAYGGSAGPVLLKHFPAGDWRARRSQTKMTS